jgi:hypothetical protein
MSEIMMPFSRYKSVRRVLGTTLLLVGLSLAMCLKAYAQGVVEYCASVEEEDPNYEQCREVLEITWTGSESIPPDKGVGVEGEILGIQAAGANSEGDVVEVKALLEERRKGHDDARVSHSEPKLKSQQTGFRMGGCLGVDVTCLGAGAQFGYSGDHLGLLFSLSVYWPVFGGELSLRSDSGAFVFLDLPGFGFGWEFGNQAVILRPKIGFDALGYFASIILFESEIPLPTGSVSILWSP